MSLKNTISLATSPKALAQFPHPKILDDGVMHHRHISTWYEYVPWNCMMYGFRPPTTEELEQHYRWAGSALRNQFEHVVTHKFGLVKGRVAFNNIRIGKTPNGHYDYGRSLNVHHSGSGFAYCAQSVKSVRYLFFTSVRDALKHAIETAKPLLQNHIDKSHYDHQAAKDAKRVLEWHQSLLAPKQIAMF